MLFPPDGGSPVGKLMGYGRWLLTGWAGVTLAFVASVYLPGELKLPGLLPIALGVAAGWGLGRWGLSMNVAPTAAVAVSAGLVILFGELAAAGKAHRDGVRIMQAQKQWQAAAGDPVTENLKAHLADEPDGISEDERNYRQEMRAVFELGEARRRQRLEYLTFSGYLAHRIPKEWGKWSGPWPALFWGAEVLLGSTLGAWMTFGTLRAKSSGANASNLPPT